MPPTGMRSSQVNRSRANALVMMQDTGTLQGEMGSPPTMTPIPNVRCRVERYKPTMPPPPSVINDTSNLYMLTVAWNQTLQEQWQFIHNGHTYEIQAVMDDDTPVLFNQAYMSRVTR